MLMELWEILNFACFQVLAIFSLRTIMTNEEAIIWHLSRAKICFSARNCAKYPEISWIHFYISYCSKFSRPSRDGIRRHQFNRRLEYFTSCYSESLLGRFERNSYFSLVLKILSKNPRYKKTRVSSWIAFCRMEKEGRKPGKNSSLRELEIMPRDLD